MHIDILTIFPQIFDSYFSESIIKRAKKKGLLSIKVYNIRDFARDKHKTVDDRPYGGGPGMILKIEPLYSCLKSIKRKKKSKVIILTPGGKTFDQKLARSLSKSEQLVFICGRYEGFDNRVKEFADLEISIGNYVLTGGEVPAMVVVDAVARLIPGVLGNQDSVKEESFSNKEDYIEYPQYTRPEGFKGMKVPKVLLSGNHKKIAGWRAKKSKRT